MAEAGQLSGVDRVFLAADTDHTPMHVTAVLIYRGNEEDSRDSDQLVTDIVGKLRQIQGVAPFFRRKLISPPMDSDHPYWVSDKEFQIEDHIYQHSFDEPADRTDFYDLLIELHSGRLDLTKPLWEAHIVDGLDNVASAGAEGFALVLKVHHAAVDGMAMLRVIGALHSGGGLQGTGEGEPDTDDELDSYLSPSPWDMWWRSYLNRYKRRQALWRTMSDVLPKLANVGDAKRERMPLLQNFKTRFNRRLNGERVFGTVDFNLKKILECRAKVSQATVNDVIVSIVGGAMRQYLIANDELPDQSLITGAPINIRGKSDIDSSANMISMMRLSLATDIADPVERLQKVVSASRQAKRDAASMGLQTLTDVAQAIDPQLLVMGVRLVNSEIMNEMISTPVHTIVSNVPGPREELTLAGGTLSRVYGLGPLKDQVGLFHAVTSVGGTLSIGFVSCSSMMLQPEEYEACLLSAYESLLAA